MPNQASSCETSPISRTTITPGELAQRWGKCRQTVYNMISSGQLRSFKVRNSRLIPISEVERIESGQEAA